MNKKNAQAAIEFISTYGWAILIIAVVLSVFFYFGILNGKFFQPRAPPGDCSVYRPGGPGSLDSIGFVGVCSGELPEYVSKFSYTSAFLNFQGSNIIINPTKFIPTITATDGRAVTLTGWIYTEDPGPSQTAFTYGNFTAQGPPWNALYVSNNNANYCGKGLYVGFYSGYACLTTNSMPSDTWVFVAAEYNNGNLIGYSVINSNQTASSSLAVGAYAIKGASAMLIASPWNGIISNVQLYNTSLSQNALYNLYSEGLAGPPTNLQYLVGWWPLNGNLNDYSGNNNNAYAAEHYNIAGYIDNYTQP
ncbi:MAG: LamG-like jellyroll fold domain-containing protein [Candidatus Micrarchaeaceae archaeon]|jgi:hypothetical protein